MVLAEAVRMTENKDSPINNIMAHNSVATATGVTGNEETNESNKETAKLAQPTLPERGILGAYEGTTTSSSRSKAPIYTRDKRTKFTQRENKKWVRLATVVGYLVAVCIPAVALSIYYIGFWDPNYKTEYELFHKAQMAEKMKASNPKSQEQEQCCASCKCPGYAESTTAGGNRGSRDLRSLDGHDSQGMSAQKDGEKTADGSYYEHVVVGKNYAIYGAVPDDSSIEAGTDATLTTVITAPQDRITAPGVQEPSSSSFSSHDTRRHVNSVF